jgi:hypothetical protein
MTLDTSSPILIPDKTVFDFQPPAHISVVAFRLLTEKEEKECGDTKQYPRIIKVKW